MVAKIHNDDKDQDQEMHKTCPALRQGCGRMQMQSPIVAKYTKTKAVEIPPGLITVPGHQNKVMPQAEHTNAKRDQDQG